MNFPSAVTDFRFPLDIHWKIMYNEIPDKIRFPHT